MDQAVPETPQPDAAPSIGRSSSGGNGPIRARDRLWRHRDEPALHAEDRSRPDRRHAAPDVVLGVLSLILWTLIIITSVKYVTVAMSIDNDGEGGILALMALLGIKKHQRPAIVAVGLFGAALIYGDGAITPAISILSALEGLNIATPALESYVLPMAVTILVGLFAIQSLGTARIGKAFGPVMGFWFLSIAALGLWGVVRHPAVIAALIPSMGFAIYFPTATRASLFSALSSFA